MKLAIVLAILASLCLAGSAGAYAICVGVTPNMGCAPLIGTLNDSDPIPINNVAGYQTWFALPINQNWVSGDPGQLNSRVFSTTHQGDWTFAAFVESSVQNPTMTIKIYGVNSTYISDLIGKRWYLRDKKTGCVLASEIWAAGMISVAQPLFTYTFTDTSSMVGVENALSVTLGLVPEPSSILALLTGIGGFGLIVRRRKN